MMAPQKAASAIAAAPADPLIPVLQALLVRPCDLAAMIGGLPEATAERWFAGEPIPDKWRPSVREAVRRFLDDAEFLLGQHAVRDPLFAASKRFAEFATRINRTRADFEALS